MPRDQVAKIDGGETFGGITMATNEYRIDSDEFGKYLKERTEFGDAYKENRKDLYNDYKIYCNNNGIKYLWSAQKFGNALKEKGFTIDEPKNSITWIHGLQLVDVPQEEYSAAADDERVW